MKKADKISAYGPIAMERMKPDAAAAMLKNRICKQMIEIHKHGEKKDQGDLAPLTPVTGQRQQDRKDQVKKVVDE